MPPSFEDHIQRQSKRALASRCTRFGVLAALLFSAVLAIAGWLDQSFAWGRIPLTLSFIILASGLLTIAILGIQSLRRARGKHLLAELDRASTLEAGYVISTSAEFVGTRSSDPMEQSMLDRLHQSAAELIASTTPRHPWPGKHLISTTCMAIAALFALLALHGTHPLRRIFQPWKHQPYTTVSVSPMPDPLPVKGEPFTLHGKVAGRIPERGTLHMHAGGDRAFRIHADGTFEIPFPEGITSPDTAVARVGNDGVSPPVPLAFRLPPKVMTYANEITPPTYTGLTPTHTSKASFALIRASTLHFGVSFEEKPANARIVFEDDREPLDLHPNPSDPRQWSADLGTIARGFGYRLHVTDAHGAISQADEPQQVVAIPDRPPTIELVKHNTADIKTRKDALKFELDAKDDFGLSAIRVQAYRVGDELTPAREIAVLNPTQPASRTWQDAWQLDLTSMNVKPMDMLVIIFEAMDGNTVDGPGRAFTDPILFEVPADAGDGEPAPSPEGGQSGGEKPETINPLAMQRQLYRETLQMSLGRGKLTMPDAAKRQQEVEKAIQTMREETDNPNPEFLKLLEKAKLSAAQAAMTLNARGMAPRGRSQYHPLRFQETTIQLLVLAAQIEREAQQNQSPPPPSDQPPPPGPKPPPKYTLISPPSSSPENKEEEQNQDEIDKALADIENARAEQEKLNQELAEKEAKEKAESKDGPQSEEGKEGEPGKEGKEGKEGSSGESPSPPSDSESPSQSQKGGKPGGAGASDGKQNPDNQPTDPQDPRPPRDENPNPTAKDGNLTERQLELGELSEEMIRRIEELNAANKNSDPKQAADQMQRAARLQREAAQALLHNATQDARKHGEEAQDALRRAGILTEALLNRSVTPGIDAGTRAPGYDDLIQGYSRRLSYDE